MNIITPDDIYTGWNRLGRQFFNGHGDWRFAVVKDPSSLVDVYVPYDDYEDDDESRVSSSLTSYQRKTSFEESGISWFIVCHPEIRMLIDMILVSMPDQPFKLPFQSCVGRVVASRNACMLFFENEADAVTVSLKLNSDDRPDRWAVHTAYHKFISEL